jgi:SAM-dependent methyltransferase
MKVALLDVLRCPVTGGALRIEEPEWDGERLRSGRLVTADGGHSYPVRNYIPRFVPASNYADNFGMQWNEFRTTQLDSHSGRDISADRFWRATGWRPEQLQGQWLLDAGCGAGRFAEVALKAGAIVVALDYSSAADACYANLSHHPNLHVVQGDIFALPLQRGFFPLVYSLGVLQHTPDVARAFAALPPMLAPGGLLCADFYWRRLRTMLHTKYLLRPLTTRMRQDSLFALLQRRVPGLLRLSQTLGRVPLAGRALKRLVPVADYTGIYGLDPRQLQEWALLDTFDMLAPAYDNPQTAATVRRWFEQSGLQSVELLHAGHLVARGHRAA